MEKRAARRKASKLLSKEMTACSWLMNGKKKELCHRYEFQRIILTGEHEPRTRARQRVWVWWFERLAATPQAAPANHVVPEEIGPICDDAIAHATQVGHTLEGLTEGHAHGDYSNGTREDEEEDDLDDRSIP